MADDRPATALRHQTADVDPRAGELEVDVARERTRAAMFGRAQQSHRVGRYLLLAPVGRGGMGMVFAAYDPQLDRKVAIKLVRPRPGRSARALALRERMVAEARAMAKVSHPNVVTIYEAGTTSDADALVYLAMELIDGVTLRRWVAERPRSWQEIVEVHLQAGRGLAAVHHAGLVHRDFKGDNVMIDREHGGVARLRVRVMDFGLARDTGESVHDTQSGESAQSGTRLSGTPGYMAPEQLQGGGVDHRADQYALCVSLFESLWGRMPAAETSVPRDSSRLPVPSRIRSAITRGLSPRVEDRWPSMNALLAALDDAPARSRTRAGLGLAGIAAVGVSVWSYGHLDRARRTAACEAQADELNEAWNPMRRQALRDAILATGVGYATTTADNVMPWLDAQAQAWRAARVGACLDAEVHERWSADTLDRSLWCLDDRRMELEALVDQLTHADADALRYAVQAASELASVAPCRDANALATVGPPPRDEREAVQAVRAEIARSGALHGAGRYDAAVEVARDAVADAERLEWRPLVAAARLRLGRMLMRTGAIAEAETALEDAYFDASHGVAPEILFEAASRLVGHVGFTDARHAEGLRWGRHAEVALASIQDVEGLRRAALLNQLGTVNMARGEFAEATQQLEEALSIRAQSLPPDHPTLAMTLADLGNASWVAEDYARAETLLERSLAIREDVLGAEHPEVAASLGNLAAVYQSTGEYDRARELFERALEISEIALGPDHPYVTNATSNVAVAHRTAGAYEDARVLFERALDATERLHGPRHPDVAMALNNLGLACEDLEDVDAAKAAYERALEIWEATLGPDHPDTAYALLGLADVALEQGRAEDAIPLAGRAVAIWEAGGIAAEDLADARNTLGHALWEALPERGRDRARAVSLVEQARDAFREAGPGRAMFLDAAQKWLDERRSESP